MRVHVEPEGCIGAGQCVLVAPEVFDQDDDGIVVLLEEIIEAHHEADVVEAINICPARVITLDRA